MLINSAVQDQQFKLCHLCAPRRLDVFWVDDGGGSVVHREAADDGLERPLLPARADARDGARRVAQRRRGHRRRRRRRRRRSPLFKKGPRKCKTNIKTVIIINSP